MSVTISIPDSVADEIYWFLLEVLESGDRGSDEARRWLEESFRPKVAERWKTSKTLLAAYEQLEKG